MFNPRFGGATPFASIALAAVLAAALLSAARPASGQGYDKIGRERTKKMLEGIAQEVEKRYYDETYRGIDVKGHFAKAQLKLENATSFNQAFRVIAQALLDFDDSHTFFVPPGGNISVDYGWRMIMIGDECYVTAVRPGSDADAKGLRAGDRVVAVEGHNPTRADLWKLQYLFHTLSPMRSITLDAKNPNGQVRRLQIASKVEQQRRLVDLTSEDGFDLEQLIRDLDEEQTEHVLVNVGHTVVWKMPSFNLSKNEIEDRLGSRLKPGWSLILDLRGNGGGYVSTLEDFTAWFFDREIRIAERKGRKTMKPMAARKRRGTPFSGRLVVLIDNDSSSAAELFARVVQLENRGVVLGDRSAGAVMQSESFSGELGTDRVVLYGASITTADLIMKDGKSLERVGVVPDELILPTAEDLAARRDPVLARAAAIAGETLTAQAAGALFPVRWK